MGPDPIQALVEENEKLQVGKTVAVNWIDAQGAHHGRGRITAVKPKRVRISLQQQHDHNRRIVPGRVIEVPRITDTEYWSSENCVTLERPGNKKGFPGR
ncbi:hypothetical protein C2E25_11075 [Geothermobacter hydrogeniphilus]|uniref:Uncharacterized protein n=1 Tax=Geothermobacter hydrogeniphilus TaxID=1969733 RepID=A0A2K2H924_9BACT|nr:hypothetical protein [Geothermobacter hydrogeniphilus]PNU19729.1 hypothetical protein C2E25_11075 [Geothermobacter hydrogeniphilus]